MQNEVRPWQGTMRPLNYDVLFDVEDYHWWFVGRRAIVFAQIEEALAPSMGEKLQILDIGCGTGATMDRLRDYGQVQGIDLSEIPLGYSRRRGHQGVFCASATALPFADNSFDLVTALDVIEHLDDDLRGLAEIRRVLKPGAPAMIFVPAFQALWGHNDVQSGHKRRYRIDQLRPVIDASGLRLEKISYANMAMFLPIWVGRKILNLLGRTELAENRINHRLLNRLMARIFSSEADWLRSHTLPFGVSIISLARK
ncbi:MAG: class I SAM-dependent methyltransferase [Acidobacteria bacterium]|nr:class I SAM-dependent methyltransferase [Acidobacteriota bacterium]